MIIDQRDTIPDPAERDRLNRRLHTHGEETGRWDADGVPAPWPDNIDTWPAPVIDTDSEPPCYDADENPLF